jgi:uncharacterized protein
METTALHVRVKRSKPGCGLGLFAVCDLAEGAAVVEYVGMRIPAAVADRLKTRYIVEVDDEWSLDGSTRVNMARYINHACEPNCVGELEDGRIVIVTLRAVRAGEELTLDYGEEYFDEFIRPIGCKCDTCS